MDITYEKLSEKSWEDFLNSICYAFANYEGISKSLKISKEELKMFFSPFVQNSFDHSYIAKDLKRNKIIGGILCNDLAFFINSHFSEECSSELCTLIKLLSTLEGKFIEKQPSLIKENITFYCYALYVDQAYNGNGIGTNLSKLADEHAKKRNFKNGIGILTGITTQHLYLNKFGFKKIDEIHYKDFIDEEKTIFSEVDAPTCILAMKEY